MYSGGKTNALCRSPSLHLKTEVEKVFWWILHYVCRDGIISISLVAINLAYIFVSMLSREIGWKFWCDVGSLPGFGRVMTRALSISGGREEEEAASLHTLVR